MKQILILLIFSFSLMGLNAQDMTTLFTNMPDQNIPQLENAWRKDLIELYNSGKEARLQNMMNGYSVLKKLTSDYLLLEVTERSTVEMKLLPLVNNTNIICLITTVSGPVADSRVEFFSPEWEKLSASDLFTPVSFDWFIREDVDKSSSDYLDAMSRLDIKLIQYQLSSDALTLTATLTTPLYLPKEERDKVTPFIKPEPKVYTWEKFHFK